MGWYTTPKQRNRREQPGLLTKETNTGHQLLRQTALVTEGLPAQLGLQLHRAACCLCHMHQQSNHCCSSLDRQLTHWVLLTARAEQFRQGLKYPHQHRVEIPSKNHRINDIGMEIYRSSAVQLPVQASLPRNMHSWVLCIFKDAESTMFLSNLFQCEHLKSIRKLFPTVK